MERKDISKSLASTLDSILPDWIEYVDEDQVIGAKNSEMFSDFWLLRHLLSQIKRKSKEDGRGCSHSIISGLLEKSSKEIMEEYRKLNDLCGENIKILVDLEKEILKLDTKGKRRSNNIEEIKKISKSLFCDLSRVGEVYDHQISNLRELTMERVKLHDISRAEEMEMILDNRISKFRREYRRNARRQRRLLKGKLFIGFCTNRLSQQDTNKLASKIAKMMISEIGVQKKLRIGAVNYILKNNIRKSGTKEIIGFLNEQRDLSEQDRRLVESFIDSGYFPQQLNYSTIKKRKSTHITNLFSKGISCGYVALNKLIDDLKNSDRKDWDYIEEVFGGNISRVCNGSWWSEFAHMGNAGLCSRCSVDASLVCLFRKRIEERKNIFIALDIIFFFTFLPLQFVGSIFFSSKFLEIMHSIVRVHGGEHIIELMELVNEKINELAPDNGDLIEWLVDFPNELTKYLGI